MSEEVKINEKRKELKRLQKVCVNESTHYKKRYKKLKSENNLKSDVLFYNKMIGMDYESSKKIFFKDVGR